MILCTGPESSGTHLVEQIVRENLKLPTIHRSLPHQTAECPDPWDWEVDADRTVFVHRNRHFTALSQVKRGLSPDYNTAREKIERAMGYIDKYPDTFVVSYESFMLYPRDTIWTLARWLGVAWDGSHPPIFDATQKYAGDMKYVAGRYRP